jgi:hypothetical protein
MLTTADREHYYDAVLYVESLSSGPHYPRALHDIATQSIPLMCVVGRFTKRHQLSGQRVREFTTCNICQLGGAQNGITNLPS